MRDWLSRQARAEAWGRSALWAGRFALVGTVGIALALFAERAGFDLPWLKLPTIGSGEGLLYRVLGWFVISTAGLLQAAVLVAAVLATAFVLRFALGPVLKRRPGAVARQIDERLRTERFSAALEAQGPFRPLVEREALTGLPPDGLLAPHRGRRRLRFLNLLALALVFVIAILPGTAPGADGDAPVLGAPDPGQRENRLKLTLTGPSGALQPNDPIMLELLGETTKPPSRDLELPVFFVLDETVRVDAGQALFLPAGADGQDSLEADLGAMLPPLKPGEHTVYALAGGARSNKWKFRIEGDNGGGGQNDKQPKKQQKKKPKPEHGGAALPPARPRFVEPLVREGEKVEKRARVPIEVPGGGAPRESSIEEAWPELERRKEAALNRSGLSPAARELVRRYFEELRPAEEKK
ncbi:MAG: hypothetical protein ACYTHK_11235 [Planctomycetota bacterium]